MGKATAILVIITSTNSCTVDNINGAEVIRLAVGSQQECERAASVIDPKPYIRAYCEKDQTND